MFSYYEELLAEQRVELDQLRLVNRDLQTTIDVLQTRVKALEDQVGEQKLSYVDEQILMIEERITTAEKDKAAALVRHPTVENVTRVHDTLLRGLREMHAVLKEGRGQRAVGELESLRKARLRSAEESFADLVEANADPRRGGDYEFRNQQIQRLTREIRHLRQEMKTEDRPASQP